MAGSGATWWLIPNRLTATFPQIASPGKSKEDGGKASPYAMGFMGHDKTSLDAKRRLVIAAKFRRALHPDARETFVLTGGLDGCIYAYPLNEWPRIMERLSALPPGDPRARYFQRTFLHYADECALDNQGRIVVPQPLAERAGVNEASGVLVKGNGDHLEVWPPEKWTRYEREQEERGLTVESLAEEALGQWAWHQDERPGAARREGDAS